MRPVLVVGGLVGGLLAAAYVVTWLAVGSQVPRGVVVAGVPLGGLSSEQAVMRLDDQLAPRAGGVDVTVGGQPVRVVAARAGLAFDPAATVTAAGQRSLNPLVLVRQLLGQSVDPVVTVDDGALGRTVSQLARRIDDAARQGGVRYDGLNVVAVTPRAGLALDVDAARDAILASYLRAEGPVELPVRTVEPKVSASEVRDVADGLAVQAVSAPVTLTVEGTSVEVPPQLIAATVDFVPRDGHLVPKVDGAAIHEALAKQFAPAETPPLDATFKISDGHPVVVPSSDGRGVDDGQLATAVARALPAAGDARIGALTVGPQAASLTTREARALGVRRVVSSYTQYFPYAAYRVTNIGVAARHIQGTVLRPGDTFSLNDIVGERTPQNGFVKGYVISTGNRLVEDYGGAVSTITTATWHTAFFAGMTRLEQRAHGFWISRYTPGLEATVAWGLLDLKFRNDTPYGVFITTQVTDYSVTITMWSTKYWDIGAEFGPRTAVVGHGTVYDTGAGCVAQDGVDGFDITVTRVWSRDGAVVRREPMTTHYDPAPTVVCSAKPSPTPSPRPSVKPSASASPRPVGSGTSPSPQPTS